MRIDYLLEPKLKEKDKEIQELKDRLQDPMVLMARNLKFNINMHHQHNQFHKEDNILVMECGTYKIVMMAERLG